jgi:hypothetical protein
MITTRMSYLWVFTGLAVPTQISQELARMTCCSLETRILSQLSWKTAKTRVSLRRFKENLHLEVEALLKSRILPLKIQLFTNLSSTVSITSTFWTNKMSWSRRSWASRTRPESSKIAHHSNKKRWATKISEQRLSHQCCMKSRSKLKKINRRCIITITWSLATGSPWATDLLMPSASSKTEDSFLGVSVFKGS